MPTHALPREGVFISYARADGEATARALQQRLATEAPEIRVWIDRLELEGGVGWWNQIEQQLDRVEFLLLVMSPAAMHSENTRREWRAARQRGVCVYPVKAGADAALDFGALPLWMRKAHFHDLAVEWPKLLAHLRRGCRATRVPFMAPPLPPAYVPRAHEGAALERLVLADVDAAATGPVVLRGPGGFGKSSLATALCHDDRVIEQFDDGVLWVSLGPSPNLAAELLKLYAALTGERPGFVDIEDAARELGQRLEDKNCLLVIDDAWSVAHVRPFLHGRGPRRLVTTRVFDVADMATGNARIDVDCMSADEALQLLLVRANLAPADAEPCRRLATRLGRWPLSLKLAASAIRQRMARGDALQSALQYLDRSLDKHGVTALDRGQLSESGGATIESTLAPSLALLDATAQPRYAALCVFPQGAAVPLPAVAALWQLDELDTEDLARRLDDLALADFDLRRGTLRLHDVLHSVLLTRAQDLPALHGRLVTGWLLQTAMAAAVPEATHGALRSGPAPLPASLPAPSPAALYAWRRLAHHMCAAGRSAELRALLLNADWLAAKLAATDIHALIADFDAFSTDAPMHLLRDALRLSAAALSADPAQLPTQLLARLMTRQEPELVALLGALRQRSAHPLLLPLHPTLDMPGGMLAMTLAGHERAVTALACSGDGAAVLSASEDGTVRVWSADGSAVRTLRLLPADALSTALPARAIAVDSAGQTALCGAANGRVYLLDLAQGVVAGRLIDEPGHAIYAVALSGDGRLAVCGGRAHELAVWDVPARRLVQRLVGHQDRVNAVAVSADGRLAVSGSDDHSICVWDLATGTLLRTLHGHAAPVRSVALSRDGHTVLSGSADRTLRVWDTVTGACRQRLSGHDEAVTAVDLSADGLQALSGASNRVLHWWDVAQGRLLRQLTAHGDTIHAVHFGRLPATAITASADRSIKLWRLDEPASATADDLHDGAVTALAFSPDGRLCASGGAEGRIRLWDVHSGSCTAVLGQPSTPVRWLGFTPDGHCVASGTAGAEYRLWFIDTRESVWIPVRHLAPVDHSTFSHNARYLLTACSDRFVYLWDAVAGTLIHRWGTRRLFDHLITPSPKRLAQQRDAGNAGDLPALDAEQLLDTYLPGETLYQVAGLTLSDDGRHAAISAAPVRAGAMQVARASALGKAADDARVVVLNLETGALSTADTGQSMPVHHVGLAAGGGHVAWGAPDHALHLWDCAADRLAWTAPGHTGRLHAVAIATTLGLVVSAAADKSVRVWRLADGAAVSALVGDNPMRTLRLSMDERMVAVGDATGRVHWMRLAPPQESLGPS